MIRITRNLGMAIALLLLAPLSAQALGISIANVSSTGGDTSLLQPGEVITFDLVLNNSGVAGPVFGLGLGARGHDADANGEVDDGLSFAGGSVADSVLNSIAVPSTGPGEPNQAFLGITNLLVAPDERGFYNPINFERVEKHVLVFQGVSLTGATGDGSLDVGLGGNYVSDGDIHFQISFEATPTQRENRAFTLDFGDMVEFGQAAIGTGGALIDFSNVQYSVTVVPEPGTALLMGLGLLGLSTRRR